MESKLDTGYLVETPEGIDLRAEVAGPVPRILAYSIDLCYRSIALSILSVPLVSLGQGGMGILLVISFLLEWFYPVVFEVFWQGQTPGKKHLGIKTLHEDMTPVNWSSSTVRNLLRFADFLPFAYLAGLLTMVLNRNFQRLGDMAAGTIVVYTSGKGKLGKVSGVKPLAPQQALTADEQVAIIEYTHRINEFSTDRQEELANILSGLTNKKDQQAVRYIKAMGSWFLGSR